MGIGPVPAVQKLFSRTGLAFRDIDLVELNEAFAAQVIPCRDELGIDPEKLNINGGAIALGHPFGMTGARIMTTLLNNLDSVGGRYGLESMCVAGGLGQAMIVERLS
jgi:acetyl-CoA C-acetyltransferase